MFYIYCYINNFNNKKYIGQTSNLARRISEHKYAANTENSPEYNSLFHKKLREYGEENFTIKILEEIDTTDTNYVDAREQYWINKEQSYVKDGYGYNLTLGGQNNGRHKTITTEQIEEVIQLLENSSLTYKEINQKTGRSLKAIVEINRGTFIGCPIRNYPIRQLRNISQETKDIIKELLITTKMTRQEIADLTGVSLSTVKRIKTTLK